MSPYLPLRAQPLFCYVIRLSEKSQKVKSEMHTNRTFCKLFYVMCATRQNGHFDPQRVTQRTGARLHQGHRLTSHHSSHPWEALCIRCCTDHSRTEYPSCPHHATPVVTKGAIAICVPDDDPIFGDVVLVHVLPFSLLLVQLYHGSLTKAN